MLKSIKSWYQDQSTTCITQYNVVNLNLKQYPVLNFKITFDFKVSFSLLFYNFIYCWLKAKVF